MRFLPLALSLVYTSVVLAQKVSYDGYKVFRVQVREDVEMVNGVIDRLGLATWKGAKRAGAAADIVVPPNQVEDFKKEIEGLDAVVMHHDLGASINTESDFHIYAGMWWYPSTNRREVGKGHKGSRWLTQWPN